MSQLDSTIQFWKATGGYLCVAKVKIQNPKNTLHLTPTQYRVRLK